MDNHIHWSQKQVDAHKAKMGQKPIDAPAVDKPKCKMTKTEILPRLLHCFVIPIGKPRMTQRDKWAKRDCVLRYHDFADKLREYFKSIDLSHIHSLSWTAYFPMPDSWSKKKKRNMRGQPHWSKPDRDNMDKAILDALFKNDSGISIGILSKRWDDGDGARIDIEIG